MNEAKSEAISQEVKTEKKSAKGTMSPFNQRNITIMKYTKNIFLCLPLPYGADINSYAINYFKILEASHVSERKKGSQY